jgi:hypothetical protein
MMIVKVMVLIIDNIVNGTYTIVNSIWLLLMNRLIDADNRPDKETNRYLIIN